jgi:NADH-ubiquinone oxidoreductase chain 5
MRSSPLLEYSPTVLVLCLWVGGFTTLVAGLIAIVSNDIKRVIAYSTMAQLGMMVIAIGLSSYNMALFHLFCHAFFKALLFMSAGSIIHSIASESQDMRKYGGLLQFLPFTYLSILIASLSLMAIPGLTGFYSKDIIIESSFGSFTISGFIMYWISVISATLTSGYSIRVLYLTFLSTPNSPRNIYTKVHEPGLTMGIPMIILTIFSIFIGYLTKDFYLGIGGNSLLFNVLFIHPNHTILPDTEFGVPTLFKILPLFTSLAFSFICFISYEFFPNTFFKFTNVQFVKAIYSFFNQKFFFDAILNNVILRSGLSISGILNKSIDKGALQFLGPRGLSYILLKFSNNLSVFESGYVTYYSLHFITVTIIFFLIFTFFNIYLPLIYLILLFINYQVKN